MTLYQETYDRDVYAHYHPQGPKADYDYRLNTLDRAASAGMREIGMGALLGLTDFRLETTGSRGACPLSDETILEVSHFIFFSTTSPCASGTLTKSSLSSYQRQKSRADDSCPSAVFCRRWYGYINTRKSGIARQLVKLGITRMSAGSKTNPGGYSGKTGSVGQFEVDDSRSPSQIAADD